MHDYMVQGMARQRIEDLHREASAYRIARVARGRKRGRSKRSKRHRATLKGATAP